MVNKDKIRAFVTNVGTVIGEEINDALGEGYVRLEHPFRVMPTQDGRVAIAALLIKEEWCIIHRSNVIEINVNEGMQNMYVDYEAQLHGSIIQAPDPKIIL